MREIVKKNELLTLPKERIWKETQLALQTDSPRIFFILLDQVGALKQSHAAISDVFLNTKNYGLKALDLMCKHTQEPCDRFAALLCGLFSNKSDILENTLSDIAAQLTLPNDCKDLITHTLSLRHQVENVFKLNSKQILALLHKLDQRRKPKRFEKLLKIFTIVNETLFGTEEYPQAIWIKRASQNIDKVEYKKWVKAGLTHHEIAKNFQHEQIEILEAMISENN